VFVIWIKSTGTERVTCLSDPTRMDSKLAESLHALLHRVRQLLLASYSKVLTRFEENMRAQTKKELNQDGIIVAILWSRY